MKNNDLGGWHTNGTIPENNGMKNLITLLLLVCSISASAHFDKHPEKTRQNCSLQVSFLNHHKDDVHADSVLVIFDKYDHTGAGIIYKVFYPDQNQTIDIDEVPAGKYYVSIRCLGIHKDYIEKLVKVEKNKSNSLKIKLQDCEMFTKEGVIIPPVQTNLMSLSVTALR